MRLFSTTSLVSVIPVRDLASASDWYQRWLGAPDERPTDGMAEWQINGDNHLLLDSSNAALAGNTAVVLGVNDVEKSRDALLKAGIDTGAIVEYGVVRACDFHDPDGNRITLAQMNAS